ncbi:pentapeptide repeat-containing protein [Streptomyces chumphonensis]|uniref:Pentapeptide repeat-containing protein n=1 Tax=Streptomyces chumphonensis TaxID=1214925 RepID=A0A927ICX7_9ACTN|nr:pentapeptide repeat-containing protein [Streptomyces chumphonensis]MBD3932522.1 pentapeptide repeat-containing protein [Streptomyces chumphonensis]
MDDLSPGAGAAVNGFRTGIAALGVGAAALVSLYFAHRTYELGKSAQFTDRFSKAVEMLSANEEPTMALGGIYALERVMKDSPYDRSAVIEVLAAHIRRRSSFGGLSANASPSYTERNICRAEDVAAALTVLARREFRGDDPQVDLSRCDLRRFSFSRGANFRNTDFSESHLGNCYLPEANFSGSYFRGTLLTWARVEGADLSDCAFPEADMTAINLAGAKLDGSNLMAANGLRQGAIDQVRSAKGAVWPDGVPQDEDK